ncbi:hypothetical protein JT359_04930 [Candidatus Poribacteria bacterium]|nr:hypothetical protein [Candidatus Poribacteria bacterium]
MSDSKQDPIRNFKLIINSALFCILISLIMSSSVQAKTADLTREFGIGAHGATPSFGGISLRYNSLSPVYLQAVGRFYLVDENTDHMFGGGISYAIYEYKGKWNHARLYFSFEGGWRFYRDTDYLEQRIEATTFAGGISFGGELIFPLGGIPLGINMSIGQGFGTEIFNSVNKNLAGVYIGAGIHAYF